MVREIYSSIFRWETVHRDFSHLGLVVWHASRLRSKIHIIVLGRDHVCRYFFVSYIAIV